MGKKKNIDLSIIIITLNEEHDLPRCLASLPLGAEVVVVDSHSTDRTVEIAKNYGAKVSVSPFVNYADQKNKALSLATRTWVFSIDADEVMSPDLTAYLQNFCPQDVSPEVGGFEVDGQLVFMGRKVGLNSSSVRLFKRTSASFQGESHEKVVFSTACRVVKLGVGVLYHHSYADVSDFYSKLNSYTTTEAERLYRGGKKPSPLFIFRPFFDFIKFYFLRRLFLRGRPGYSCALLMSMYSFVKYAKLAEMYKLQSKG